MPQIELKWTLSLMVISGLIGAFIHNYWSEIIKLLFGW